jgi:hypothetical protein
MRSMSDRINEGDVDEYNIITNKPNIIIRILSVPVGIGKFILSKFKRAAPIHKTYAEVSLEQIQKKPVLMFYDKVTLAIGAIIGMLGIVLIYNQLPTHPLIVIGISCVCVGVSTIVSISRW